MKTALVLMLCMLFNRPPEPTDIPFEYDKSKVNHEILKWHVIEQSKPLVTERIIIEPDGDPVTLKVVSSDNSEHIWIEQREKTAVENDQTAVRYKFYMDFRPKINDALGVFYLDVTATDPYGASDSRTILVNVVEQINRPPIIME